MHVSRKVGNYAGKDEADNIYAAIRAGSRRLSWTPAHSGAVFQAVIDGVSIATTELTYLDDCPQDARDHIEVWECTLQTRSEDLTLVAASAQDRTKLTWSAVSGAERYELYRSLTSGSYADPPIAVLNGDQTSYEIYDGPHVDDTYYYKVVAYDAAGNDVDSNEVSPAVSAAPEPPTDLSLSHNDGTGATTFTWTASTSADVAGYYLYSGTTTVELTGTPTDLGDVTTKEIDNGGVTGHREYLVRAYDAASNEEANLSQMAGIDLSAGVRVSRPNSPELLHGAAIATGQVQATVRYDRTDETGVAALLRFYVNDGAGGAIDWNTPVGTITLGTYEDPQVVQIESSGLDGAKTYKCGVRARTSGGIEDTNTAEVEVTTDATAPSAPTLTGAVV